jgi:hypothetical protein
MNRNGVVVWEGESPVDGAPIALILTGLTSKSANRKTGPMLQTWILRQDMPPLEAVRNDVDSSICGSCVHKGTHVDDKRVGRSCYVNVGQAPTSIWATYAAGRYRHVSLEEASELVADQAVRLGAYGDPGMVPWEVLYQLVRHASTYTGYTHQWRWIDDIYATVCMASVETEAEREQARALGYRCFFVRPADAPAPDHAMICAADRDRNPLNCIDCGACAGTKHGTVAGAVDVYIEAHGAGKKHVVDLTLTTPSV